MDVAVGTPDQVAACVGKEGDATPFADVTVDNISAALHRCARSGTPAPALEETFAGPGPHGTPIVTALRLVPYC